MMGCDLKEAAVLVVHGQLEAAHLTCQIVRMGGFRSPHVLTGEAGLAAAMRSCPDAVLADADLNDMSVERFCSRLRGEPSLASTPLIVAGDGSEAQHVAVLEAGADDYIAKPYSAPELISRIRAKLRRARMTRGLQWGNLRLDTGARVAFYNGRQLELTRVEYDILSALAINSGRVVSRGELLGMIHREDAVSSDATVNFHVMRIRQKAGDPEMIRTVRGTGYRLVAEAPGDGGVGALAAVA